MEEERHLFHTQEGWRAVRVSEGGENSRSEESLTMLVPERFRAASLDHIDETIFPMVADYAQHMRSKVERGVGLLLSGPAGVGKTYAVAALTRKYAERLRPGRVPDVVFHTVYEVLDKYAPIVGSHPMDELRGQTWTDTYERCRWLVLNDLGKEYRGGKFLEQSAYRFGRLLRARSERRLVTHITTNLPLVARDDFTETFETVYGESIWSLLGETMERYEVTGPDRRNAE